MNGTLLLQIRIEALWLNLQKAHERLKGLSRLTDDMKKLHERLQTEINDIADTRDVAEHFIDDIATIAVSKSRDLVSDIRELVSDISARLRRRENSLMRLQQDVDAISRNSFLVDAESVADAAYRTLNNRMRKLLRKEGKNLENILRTARPGLDSWTKFYDVAAESNNAIFTECVDLLGGFALRDVRVDANVYQLADVLAKLLIRKGDPPRAIPSGLRNAATWESIVRLYFPDWTVWALPFTAHELWHVTVRKDVEKERPLEFEGDTECGTDARWLTSEGMQLCLADAFAIYAMGPAYAFAAVTLLFDPRRSYAQTDGPACHDARVHAILEMLKHMDSGASAGSESYVDVAKKLRDAWNDAKAQADAAGGESGAAQAEVQREQAEKDNAEVDCACVTLAVKELWDALVDLGYPKFTLSAWKKIAGWPQHLINAKSDELKPPSDADLRDVLNAVWRVRVDPKRLEGSPDLDTRTEQLSLLTERAQKLAEIVGKQVGERADRSDRPGPTMRSRL